MALQINRPIPKIVLSTFALAIAACAAEATTDKTSTGTGAAGATSGTGTAGTGTSATGASSSATSTGATSATGSTASAGVGSSTGVGGAGGSTGTGSTGTGGSGTDTCGLDASLVISDFEIGTAKETMVGGRDGSWFLYNDKTVGGVQTPVKVAAMPLVAEAPGACGSGFAFHTTAMGFTGFGAGAGIDFAPKTVSGAATSPYDGSTYTGIVIHAKAAAPLSLRLSVSDANTDKEGIALGGTCVDTTDRTNPNRCGDYFGTALSITTSWQVFTIPFAMMAQNGWGMPVPAGVNKSKLFSLRVQAAGNYDLWIDNVAFLR